MSTKAYYPISEIGAGKPGFSKTRSIIEAAFYGNNVVKVNTLKEAYELAKNSPGTVVTDMPVYRGEEFGLENDVRVSTLSRYPEVFTMEEQAEDETELWNGLKERFCYLTTEPLQDAMQQHAVLPESQV